MGFYVSGKQDECFFSEDFVEIVKLMSSLVIVVLSPVRRASGLERCLRWIHCIGCSIGDYG